MENNRAVTFRRINGRVIPIRSKNGEVKKTKNQTKGTISDRFESGLRAGSIGGAAASGATFSAYKVAGKVVDGFREEAEKALDDLKPVAFPGNKPRKKKVSMKPILRAHPVWGDTPFGEQMQRKDMDKLFRAETLRAKTAYKVKNIKYAAKLRKYASYVGKRENLSFQHSKFLRYSSVLSRSMPRAVIATGLVIGGISAIANMMNNQNK
jgi:hypothetical protein